MSKYDKSQWQQRQDKTPSSSSQTTLRNCDSRSLSIPFVPPHLLSPAYPYGLPTLLPTYLPSYLWHSEIKYHSFFSEQINCKSDARSVALVLLPVMSRRNFAVLEIAPSHDSCTANANPINTSQSIPTYIRRIILHSKTS